MKSWIVRKKLDDLDSALLSGLPELARHLLFYRGILTNDEAEKFLNPHYARDVHDPYLMLNMEHAVERILRVIEGNEKTVIYADYDCDGIPGAVILHDLFKKLGFHNFSVYIPHRYDEGYGLHAEAVEKFASEGAKLLITVDTGITDIESVARAGELGIDVIITDHHLPATSEAGEEILPSAYTILNSKQKADTYPFKMLSGAGVAFKLAQAILQRTENKFSLDKNWEKRLLDLVGLSTIADMVPLTGENRALAHYGLKVLRRSSRSGLQRLFYKTGIDPDNLTEDDIGFLIAPRINSASRMGTPMNSFNLLSSTNFAEAGQLADYLETRNLERKSAVAEIMSEAENKICDGNCREAIVVGDRKWKPGVAGLVASRLVEKYGVPAFVWGSEGTCGINGSCRSDGCVDMVKLMGDVGAEVFYKFGGHALSGGFTVREELLGEFENRVVEAMKKLSGENKPRENILNIDKALGLDELDWPTYDLIAKLAPFGMENPKPVFMFPNVEIVSVLKFGKTKNHLKINLRKPDGKIIPAVAFFSDENSFDGVKIAPNARVDLVGNIEKGVFRGYPELRIRVVDIKNPAYQNF